MKFRVFLLKFILEPVVAFILWVTHGTHIQRFRIDKGQSCLILCNHVCLADPAFIQISIKEPLGFLAMAEHANNRLFKTLGQGITMISIEKGTLDLKAVKQCVKFVKSGRSLAIFPEGVRTPSGRLSYINPSIVKLIKLLKVPVVYYNIRGGFGADPTFCTFFRRGSVDVSVVAVRTPEDYAELSNEEIYEDVVSLLSVDEVPVKKRFVSRHHAQYLERTLYLCPNCGSTDTLHSDGHYLSCTCGMKVRYGGDLMFHSENALFPYKSIYDWYCAQKEWVSGYEPAVGDIIYKDDGVSLINVPSPGVHIKKAFGKLIMTDTTLTIGDMWFSLDEIDNIVPTRRHDFRMYANGETYNVIGQKRFNNEKYVSMFSHLKSKRTVQI